jgi:hypothetical protein
LSSKFLDVCESGELYSVYCTCISVSHLNYKRNINFYSKSVNVDNSVKVVSFRNLPGPVDFIYLEKYLKFLI